MLGSFVLLNILISRYYSDVAKEEKGTITINVKKFDSIGSSMFVKILVSCHLTLAGSSVFIGTLEISVDMLKRSIVKDAFAVSQLG